MCASRAVYSGRMRKHDPFLPKKQRKATKRRREKRFCPQTQEQIANVFGKMRKTKIIIRKEFTSKIHFGRGANDSRRQLCENFLYRHLQITIIIIIKYKTLQRRRRQPQHYILKREEIYRKNTTEEINVVVAENQIHAKWWKKN